MVVVLLLCAFVLDAFEMIFVVIPILIPPLLIRIPDATWIAVITLLILQTSFLLPPFGYAVMMIGNRLIKPVSMRSLAVALAPFVAAQAMVLGLVLATPALLWRSADLNASAGAAVPMSEDEITAAFEKQMREQNADGNSQ